MCIRDRPREKQPDPTQPRPISLKNDLIKIQPYKYRNEVKDVIKSLQQPDTQSTPAMQVKYLAERNRRRAHQDHITPLYSLGRKVASSQEPRRHVMLYAPGVGKPGTRQQDRVVLAPAYNFQGNRIGNEHKVPGKVLLKNSQVGKIAERRIASVEGLRRQENNKRLAEYFKASPVQRKPVQLNERLQKPHNNLGKPREKEGLIYYKGYKGYFDNHIYRNKPQYNSGQDSHNKIKEQEYRNAKQYYNGKQVHNGVIIPRESSRYQPAPIRQAGRAVLQRPHYNVLPDWWG
eukprot:TRINITY_DN3199_c0_g2_i5.p1 TRINITY_DN3199_c0_g2~~TRINITY_DN3199_c0_g2_i5.p1  ORF type:complete len:289 (+),score=30.55 TRINITY_DN3199_c0_g2_i5:79-945(+)